MPAGAWAGGKTTMPTAAPRFSPASRRSSRAGERGGGRVEAGRVEQERKARGVAVEVAAQQLLHAADGAVALGRVEQLVDVGAQGALVAEEALQRAGQAAVAVGEVLAQRLLQGPRGALIGGLRLGEQGLELAPPAVHVDAPP